jgi:PAS domain S-box-containing protein
VIDQGPAANENAFSEDLLSNAPCALASLSINGTVQWSNPAFQLLSGLTAPGISFFDALSRAGGIFYETQLVPVILLRGSVKEVALDLVRGPDDRVPVFLSANVRFDPDGTSSGIRIALFEATERRLYERDLLEARKSAEQLADVVRRALDAIITLSPDGRIQAWNGGAEQTFGYSGGEVLGRSFTELLFPARIHDDITAAVRLLQTGSDVTREITGLHKDNRELDLSMRLTPHLEPPGILIAFSAILRDVTERRTAEQALLQSEKLASVGRLASSIAHEINNPLEAVTNLLYLLGSAVTTPETKGFVRLAQEELARVSQIVTHTLRFHKQSTARTDTSLNEVLRSVLALYRGRLQPSEIDVTLQATASHLYCYEGEIRQIFANLFSNAFDAMKSHRGRIHIRCRDATRFSSGERGVRVSIADTGPGIHPSIRKRLFEPFVTTKGITGTGLGLWITRDLVEKNGGIIHLRTRTIPAPSGTVVSVWFSHATGPNPSTTGEPTDETN